MPLFTSNPVDNAIAYIKYNVAGTIPATKAMSEGRCAIQMIVEALLDVASIMKKLETDTTLGKRTICLPRTLPCYWSFA